MEDKQTVLFFDGIKFIKVELEQLLKTLTAEEFGDFKIVVTTKSKQHILNSLLGLTESQ